MSHDLLQLCFCLGLYLLVCVLVLQQGSSRVLFYRYIPDSLVDSKFV